MFGKYIATVESLERSDSFEHLDDLWILRLANGTVHTVERFKGNRVPRAGDKVRIGWGGYCKVIERG